VFPHSPAALPAPPRVSRATGSVALDFGRARVHFLEPPLDLNDDEYRRLQGDLTRALRRACPSWLESRRDDLVQLALLRVLNVKRREENAVLTTSYLYKVAYAVVVDEMRRAQWRRETSLESGGMEESLVGGRGGPEQHARSEEIARGIDDCLARLAGPRSQAVTLHLQGYSLAEAAETLAWSYKRTENLVYRGLADLRACLAAKGLKP